MIQTDTTHEEVTTPATSLPQQVIKKITKVEKPSAKGETPQNVYEKKKTIFRFNQIIWYILGLIEVLLGFRFILKMFGANASIGFTSFIYSLTEPLAGPFRGIFSLIITGNSMIELSSIIAAIVYLCIAWGLVYLLDIIYPITPKDIETQ